MKNKIIILGVILVVASCFCLYSGYHLVVWFMDNQKTSTVVKKINIISKKDINKDKTVSVDFNSLLIENKEVVGWIKLDDTSIDYPVVQHDDNDYYLKHSFDYSTNDAGWIFMDYRNQYHFLDFNTIIYGHGRRDGSMFGSLFKALDQDWISDEKHQIIHFTTLNHSYLFRIFSVYYIDTTDDYININYDEELLKRVIQRSFYSFDSDITLDDKILTLSTCYNNDKKLVVHAKMIYFN